MNGRQARAGILDLGPYPVGGSTLPGVARVTDLASNENAVAPSPAVVAAARAAAAAAEEMQAVSDTLASFVAGTA